MCMHTLLKRKKWIIFTVIPFLCLTVSGGHTQIVVVKNPDMEIIGQTIDDAIGEAFDKAGKLLGLVIPQTIN